MRHNSKRPAGLAARPGAGDGLSLDADNLIIARSKPPRQAKREAEKAAYLFRDMGYVQVETRTRGKDSRWWRDGVTAAELHIGVILLSTDGREPRLAIQRLEGAA